VSARLAISIGCPVVLVVFLCFPHVCLAQAPRLDDEPIIAAPAAPPTPQDHAFFCYENVLGSWDLKEGGTARYRWLDGKMYHDKLTLVGKSQLNGDPGFVYRANPQDGTSVGYFFFSSQPVNIGEGPRYALYYSTDGKKFQRIRVEHGTRRTKLKD